MHPIREYFATRLASREEAIQIGQAALALAERATSEGTAERDGRAVLFQPIMAPQGESAAYFSRGALLLFARAGVDLKEEQVPVALRDLPDGLGMVIGDQIDAIAYANRHRQ